jgi:hypothetical protein
VRGAVDGGQGGGHVGLEGDLLVVDFFPDLRRRGEEGGEV